MKAVYTKLKQPGRITDYSQEIIKQINNPVTTKKDLRAFVQAVVSQNRILEDSLKLRDKFLSTASHELKTPITILTLQLELVQKELKNALSSNTTELLTGCFRQLSHLTRLVDDLIDVSKIQLGKLTLSHSPFDFCEVLRGIVKEFMPQLLKAKCSVALELDETIPGDWDKKRIQQLITNLLSNVITYAAHSHVTITAQKTGTSVTFIVQDTGPGIAKYKQKEVFERFGRAVKDWNISGLGLGLFLVQHIVEAHHGTIQLESDVGKGCSFIIQLPIHLA